MATIEIINKALEALKNHDWYWMMAIILPTNLQMAA